MTRSSSLLLLIVGCSACLPRLSDEPFGPSIHGVYDYQSTCEASLVGVVSLEIVDPSWGVAEVLDGSGALAIDRIEWSPDGADLLPTFELSAGSSETFTCSGWDPEQRRSRQALSCRSASGANCQLHLDYVTSSPEQYRACATFAPFEQTFDYSGLTCSSLGRGSFTVAVGEQDATPSPHAAEVTVAGAVDVDVEVTYERGACQTGSGAGTVSALSKVVFSRSLEGTAMKEVFSCKSERVALNAPTTMSCARSFGASSSKATCSVVITPR